MDAIRRILPGSARIQGISITDLKGDTMIYAGEIQVDIRLLALLRKKVALQDVDVRKARVVLLMNEVTEQLHIAEAFTPGRETEKKKSKEGRGNWVISIHKGKLSDIHFHMSDSISGIQILQEISMAEIKDFTLPLAERELWAHSLKIEGLTGDIRLRPREAEVDKIEKLPWNFGLLNLSLHHVEFTLDQGNEALWLNLILEEGEIIAKEMDLKQKVLDLKDFTLVNAYAKIIRPQISGLSPSISLKDPGTFDWLLSGKNMELEKLGLSLGERTSAGSDSISSILSLDDLEMRMKGFLLDADQAHARLSKLSFDLDNGFSLKELKGVLESERDLTRLELNMETAHSEAGLVASAHAGFLDMLSDPASLQKAHLAINTSNFSLKDLDPFVPEDRLNPAYADLISDPFSLTADVELQDRVLEISSLSLSQNEYFQILLEGKLENFIPISKANSNLQLALTGVDPDWLKEWFRVLGMEKAPPDLSGLSLTAQVSNLISSPDISLQFRSQFGKLNASASMDIASDSFVVSTKLEDLALGALLDLEDLGSLSATANLHGTGTSLENLHSGFSFQVDTLAFNNYIYRDIRLDGQSKAGIYEFLVLSGDEHAQGELRFQAIHGDTLFQLTGSGQVSAQLDQLHLTEDTFALKTGVESLIVRGSDSFRSDIIFQDTRLTNAQESVDLEQFQASVSTDFEQTTLSSRGDFFSLDIMIDKSMHEFDSFGKSYINYLATFRDPDPELAATRLKGLPEINATGHFSDHEVLDMVLKDTGFHMGQLDISMQHISAENKINYDLRGAKLRYKVVDIESINSAITDSAGLLNVSMAFDKASLFSGPANDWTLDANFSEWQRRAVLSIRDPEDRLTYNIDIEAIVDSTQLVLELPSEHIVLNGKGWDMETSRFLTWDLLSSDITPSLKMFTDSSSLHITTGTKANRPVYTLSMNQVEMESLVREDLFPGRPDASISGTFGLSILNDSARRIRSDLHFSDVEFSDLHFDLISLSGELGFDKAGNYEVDVVAGLDSARASFRGNRIRGGNREIYSEISQFPLNTLQPFTTNSLSELQGSINGRFDALNTDGEEHVNGQLAFEGVQLKINALNSSFRIPDQDLVLAEERLMFDKFRVLDTLDNELMVNGYLDFQSLERVNTQLDISSSRLQVMSSEKVDEKAPFYGDVYVDSRFSVHGPLVNPTISGVLRLARGTELYYQHMDDLSLSESEEIVNFVSHAEAEEPSASPVIGRQGQFIKSSVETTVEIDPTTRLNVGISKKIYDLNLQITGGGALLYNMLNNNQMSLSGRYEISEGGAELKLLGWPDKSFRISEGGYIRWDGRVDDPQLNFQALNRVSSSYLNPVDGKQRPVDFDVILQLSGYLSDLDVLFTVNTPDQYLMSTINALSPEEKMRQAISILLFESIDLPGISSSSDYMSQQVNQILASQLNQLTRNTFKGVDISFGIDTYNSTSPGNQGQSSTSLSYEVRKSLMNDRAQIEVSGRMRDVNQTPGASDLSLSNIAFEYSLDSAGTKFLKVYNEHTYEDVFEGEVIKTGIGVSLRKRHRKFSDIWKREKKKKKEPKAQQ